MQGKRDGTMLDLFDSPADAQSRWEPLAPGAMVLRGRALDAEDAILAALRHVADAASFRHMITPGGYRMSVAMTNCGTAGWISDARRYRYDPNDPISGRPWPPMPASFLSLAAGAAAAAGYADFLPDA